MAKPLDAKIVKWAKANGKEKFLKSPNLLRALYAEANKAKYVEDIIDGMKAELKVLVLSVQSFDRRVCLKCNRVKCDEANCGEEDYGTKEAYAITVADEHDKTINLNLPPWYSGDVPEANHVYKISGVGKARVVGDKEIIELSQVKVEEELDEDDFTPEVTASQEADEEESEADEDEEESEEEEEPKPKKKKKVVEEEEEEEASEEEEEEEEEEEGEAPKKIKLKLDPKVAKIVEKARLYFRANDGIRKPKQLKTYLSGLGAEKHYATVVKALKLVDNDDGELEYSDDE